MFTAFNKLIGITEGGAVMLTTICVAFTVIFMSLEYLYLIYKRRFSANTFFSWEISGAGDGWLYSGWRARFLNYTFKGNKFTVMIILRLLLAVLVIINVENQLFVSCCLFVLFLISCLLNIRHTHGRDGADEVTFIVLLGLASYYAIDKTSILRWFGPGFIVAQLTLSYFISGIYKLKSRTWRDGSAVKKVIATVIYGKPGMQFIFKNKPAALFFCWAVIIWECTFPLLFFTPPPVCFVWLAMGAAFHISMALVMGLNTFMFAFLSAYPLFFLLLSKIRFLL
jgi:hypothetical protein